MVDSNSNDALLTQCTHQMFVVLSFCCDEKLSLDFVFRPYKYGEEDHVASRTSKSDFKLRGVTNKRHVGYVDTSA